MQYLEGKDLAALIRERAGFGHAQAGPAREADPAPPATRGIASNLEEGVRGTAFYRAAASLALQVAEALDHAHPFGIIHRNVKPANLLIDEDGRPRVSDFGLARLLQADTGLTRTGDLVGTLRYMNPEQALGSTAPIDARTDEYSLGATLYELLTPTPAFGGHNCREILRGPREGAQAPRAASTLRCPSSSRRWYRRRWLVRPTSVTV